MTERDNLPELKPRWGDTLIYCHTNMWGEPSANIYEYTYAGAKGKFPYYIYRFTRIGDASIAEDEYQDIRLTEKDMVVGKQKALGCIQSYTRATPSLDSPEMVDRVAKAIYAHFGMPQTDGGISSDYFFAAKAAIKAIQEAS